jgi:hypothetical protein
MNIRKWVILITVFLIANTYYDGKFTDYLILGKKYYKMIMYGFIGLSIYMFMKKHPNESQNMLIHANSLIKYMPIDKNTTDLISPIMDFTNIKETFNNFKPNPNVIPHLSNNPNYNTPQMRRMMNSGMQVGGNKHKRCVSESKKKFVAAQQQWKCAMCSNMLDATFEVDHKVDLQFGGSNHVSNLAALCPNCHRKKTLETNIQ